MTKLQLTVISSAILLFLILYLGCKTKPPKQQALEKSRVLVAESTDIRVLLSEAKSKLRPIESSEVLALEQQIAESNSDSLKVELWKTLSGKWYSFRQPAIAGYYAQNIAESEGSEEAWSIAGTTYAICVQNHQEAKIRSYCSSRAIKAFENAISLNPDNIAHQVNLALSYAENPPQDNPMKGVLMLIELNKANPDNVLVLNNLGRLAIKTGQTDRAIQRLEKAASIEPDNRTTNCLLARVYEQSGQSEKAQIFARKCESLN